MKNKTGGLLLTCMFGITIAVSAQEARTVPTPIPDIPYEKFILDNGLTLIVHEDHKAPIVAVNVWYHVGSKNEPAGNSGFAHLFEHLMFNGSEHFNDDYFQVLERVGATDLNGTTNRDRTNYFQNVPTSALDLSLWMESDRMGHLLGAIDQDKLDEQRGVVQNEKRQGENQPYGQVFNLITEATYPDGHPYAHTVIGSMEDLDAASVEDVHNWFQTYYGPSNAVLVVAGDIDAQTAKEKVEQFFGDIPPGPPIAKHETWIAKRTGEHRQVLQDRVPQARIYKVWNVPEIYSSDYNLLDIVSDVLSSGKNSRFFKRLVYEDQIATNVSAGLNSGEIGSQFIIQATARPGQDLSDVERAIDEELSRFLAEGPEESELLRVKTQQKAQFIRGIERIGGFGGKSDILAYGEVYGDSPEAYKQSLLERQDAAAAAVQAAAQTWLSDGVYVLEVYPFPTLQAAEDGADRSNLPSTEQPAEASFPSLQRVTLSNGMKVILAERHSVPLVDFSLQIDAGYAADQFVAPGTANLTMSMLDEGTSTRSALEISDELAMLGAQIGSGSNLDMSTVSLSALKENLNPSIELYADIVLNPSFPQLEMDRLKQQQLAGIQNEKVSPMAMALRVFPKLLYGDNHAYSLPFTGSGTEASVAALTRDDPVGFHSTWFKPNNATMVVVGDVTMDELLPLLERNFSTWRRGDVPQKNISAVERNEEETIYLLDRPGAQQSIVFAGHVTLPTANPDEVAVETMNTILGGAFTSRINMNLREDKGWSYGAFSTFIGARGQRPFLAYGPVQTDKSVDAMIEIRNEINGVLSDKPVTDDEVAKAKSNLTLTLSGQWETNDAVLGSINQIVRYGFPDNYFATYAGRVQAIDTDQIADAAVKALHPESIVWIIVGDRQVIESEIRALELGTVYIMDADGNVLE